MSTAVALAAARRARGESVTYARGARAVSVWVLWAKQTRERRDTQAGEARLAATSAALLVPASDLLLDGEATPITPQLGDRVTDSAGQTWKVGSLQANEPPWRQVDRTPDWIMVYVSR